MLVDSGNTVDVWMLLFIAMVAWIEAEVVVVGREHAGHRQKGLDTYREMPEHYQCARWGHC